MTDNPLMSNSEPSLGAKAAGGARPTAVDDRRVDPASGWRALFGRWLIALVVVFLLFGPYISQLLREETRELFMWQSGYAAYFLVVIGALATGATLVTEVVRWVNRPLLTRLGECAFVMAVAGAVLANVCHHMKTLDGYHFAPRDWETQTLWMLLFGALGYSMARKSTTLLRRCRQACLIVSPIAVLLSAQLWRLESHGGCVEPFPQDPPAAARLAGDGPPPTPVYLFVFDEWSYARTYEGGRLPADLPHLAALQEQAVVFHDAHAPGEATLLSMPGLLFQTDLPVFHEQQKPGRRTVFSKTVHLHFERGDQTVPGAEFDDLFQAPKAADYRTMIVGFACPYREWLGDRVDVYRSYPWMTCYMGDNLLAHGAVHLYKGMAHWTDPWSGFLRSKVRRRVRDAQAMIVYQQLRDDILTVLRDQPRKTAALLHYPLPHDPYILDAEGRYLGPQRGTWDLWVKPSLYHTNIRLLDRFIGGCVAAMKQRGTFDDALIIMTSDHSWRYETDPRFAGPMTHVPLIIKLPGQTAPRQFDGRFDNHRLGALIARVLNPRGASSGPDAVLDAILAPPPGGDLPGDQNAAGPIPGPIRSSGAGDWPM